MTGNFAAGFRLYFPFWHLFFTPFCSMADFLTVLSVKQSMVLVSYVLGGLLLGLPFRRAWMFFMAFVAFLAWAVLVPRPMSRLVPADPDILLIDFHSHTRYSHDGRPMFTPEKNMEWHRQQGYGASFITDHNRIEASQEAKAFSKTHWSQTGYRSLEGEEISLWKTHLVLLGNHERIDNRPYDSDWAKIPRFIKDMHKKRYLVIASLPEYWLYHWGQGVQDFVQWGIDGFEIINSAPKALDFPPSYKRQIIDLCYHQNLFITGISDNHGYGYATAVWNAVRMPGWQQMEPDPLEKMVLKDLKRKGFQAVQVLERVKYAPKTPWELAVSPLINLLIYWRSLHVLQVFSWVGWIWLACLSYNSRSSRSHHG